ncbi:efflux RND transporter permease subunit [Thalassomonas actiniarum]|uniref:MMPL family transporter n=1 Tax=Thalassomonas actiniarum TaxID=485447 RepID=A0AAF0C4R9_9GAMM|nr:MMPL family transporter [Thalassomonas actiniarum]WDE00778.1 MMPL family transporter [Thalassomonas actiniarum]
MVFSISAYYERFIIDRPKTTLAVIALVVLAFTYYAPGIRLDASADTLILENDQSLKYYRGIKARYGSDDYLFVTYSPKKDLFSQAVLDDLKQLRDKLAAINGVSSVVSIWDVPLINSPRITLDQLQDGIRTLSTPGLDTELARKEFISSPLYKNMLISEDGQTTGLQVNITRNEKYYRLLTERNGLREKQLKQALTPVEQAQLEQVSKEFYHYTASLQQQLKEMIAGVRQVLDQHRGGADIFLGGIPMITADSIDYIAHDLTTFSVGVLAFIIFILAIAFGRFHWVVLPMVTCFCAGSIMLGLLTLLDWPITVVSANFISLMLIVTLSLTVHLIVRYQELHSEQAEAEQRYLVLTTMYKKLIPCFYTTTTTMIAFGSLLISFIRPLIDFGWMMIMGMAVSFILAFTLFPATLMLLKPGKPAVQQDLTSKMTKYIAGKIQLYPKKILSAYALLVLFSIAGIGLLTVENRFIDYFKKSTEIYQGMELIDQKLGGTTPLEVVLDAPAAFFEQADEEEELDEEFLEEFGMDAEDFSYDDATEAGITGSSYWFNVQQLDQVRQIHEYLESLGETGKVLSIASTMAMLKTLDPQVVNDNFMLSVLHSKLSEEIKASLVTPYMSEDGNQLRFGIRIFESDPNLKREQLLEKIREKLTGDFQLERGQIHLTGMVVLYNNMLQSLFKSQILTIGVVFLAILLMFLVLFRNFKLSLIALIPNMVAAAMVLGLMGFIGIPLDLMTITIAAICIGIAVDNSIHYVDRFNSEFDSHKHYWLSVRHCHGSIGKAMYYTSITITLGFSILALSNFVPTVYFGLLTGFAMLMALFANMTLLPLLIVQFKPRGQAQNEQPPLETIDTPIAD